MSVIGRLIDLPMKQGEWGRFRDEYGNTWNIHGTDIPEDKEAGDSMAYRLDFSDPKGSPKVVADD